MSLWLFLSELGISLAKSFGLSTFHLGFKTIFWFLHHLIDFSVLLSCLFFVLFWTLFWHSFLVLFFFFFSLPFCFERSHPFSCFHYHHSKIGQICVSLLSSSPCLLIQWAFPQKYPADCLYIRWVKPYCSSSLAFSICICISDMAFLSRHQSLEAQHPFQSPSSQNFHAYTLTCNFSLWSTICYSAWKTLKIIPIETYPSGYCLRPPHPLVTTLAAHGLSP